MFAKESSFGMRAAAGEGTEYIAAFVDQLIEKRGGTGDGTEP